MGESNAYEYFDLINRISPITRKIISAQTEEEFDDVFDDWLVQAIDQLERDKAHYHQMSEDGISGALANALRTGEILVTREENSNGHVDLTIKRLCALPPMTKLGEAKIWKGKKYHIEGLDQLINRYSTGRGCRGFVISYVKKRNIKNKFNNLRDYINQTKPHDFEGQCKDHKIKWSFLSSHKHTSGDVIDICHLGCNLYVDNKV